MSFCSWSYPSPDGSNGSSRVVNGVWTDLRTVSGPSRCIGEMDSGVTYLLEVQFDNVLVAEAPEGFEAPALTGGSARAWNSWP